MLRAKMGDEGVVVPAVYSEKALGARHAALQSSIAW